MIEKVYLVGLTGPTGSGKSEVSRVMAERHIPVIDADALAREVVEPGSECLKRLAEEFSEDILQEDGSLNRRQLAKRAFATPEDTRLLNSITHPYIIERTKQILMTLEQMREPAAILDAPLLFESGMNAVCEFTAAVVAPAGRRLQRIMQRDHIPADTAKQRMDVQLSESFFREHSDAVLENNADFSDLWDAAQELSAKTIRYYETKYGLLV